MRGVKVLLRNLLKKRQRNAQQDTKTLWSLAGKFHFLEQKRIINLAGFHALLLK